MCKLSPVSLHPDNKRYFYYDNKQTVLVGSCEDYGCLINSGFDYRAYLRELKSCGLNHDRVFSGIFREIEGVSFEVQGNILAPDKDHYIAPWARSDKSGASDGGNRFDLNVWDNRFWDRLHDYMDYACELGIIVEFVLFCTFYHCYFEEELWEISPLHPNNNINATELPAAHSVYSLDNKIIMEYMDKMTVKFVEELNRHPNLIIEICNEPWNDNLPQDWLLHISDLIVKTEASLPNKHLISLDISCGYEKLTEPLRGVSVYNFHYALGQTAEDNQALELPIGLNETGFWGQGDDLYRQQAWQFMLSGGSLFTNLDYSFSVGYEDGTFPSYGDKQPGGGSKTLRTQLGYLLKFLNTLPLAYMKPSRERLYKLFANSPTITMMSGDFSCCGYIRTDSDSLLELALPAGQYRVANLDTVTGELIEWKISHSGGLLRIKLPKPSIDETAFSVLLEE